MTDDPPPPYTASAESAVQLPSPAIQVHTTFISPATSSNSYIPTPVSNTFSPQTPSSVASPSTPSTNPRDLERSGFVSALPYFELRSPSQMRPADTIYHHLMVDSETSPVNLWFPEPSDRWHIRGVDRQDCMYYIHLTKCKRPQSSQRVCFLYT